jgi:hypothetical protein
MKGRTYYKTNEPYFCGLFLFDVYDSNKICKPAQLLYFAILKVRIWFMHLAAFAGAS